MILTSLNHKVKKVRKLQSYGQCSSAMYKILTLFTLGLISCKQPVLKIKTLNSGIFTLKTSGEWRLIDTATTVESIGKMLIKYFRGRIKVGDTDTLSFELSRFAYIFQEYT